MGANNLTIPAIGSNFKIQNNELINRKQYDGYIYAAGYSSGSGTDDDFTVISLSPISGIKEEPSPSEPTYYLSQNTPNPFSKKTVIEFRSSGVQEFNSQLPNSATPQLIIYDLTGRLDKSFLLSTDHYPLTTAVSWDGTNDLGEKVSPGVYFYKLKSGVYTSVKKMILVR